jgi:hypothetical protein
MAIARTDPQNDVIGVSVSGGSQMCYKSVARASRENYNDFIRESGMEVLLE